MKYEDLTEDSKKTYNDSCNRIYNHISKSGIESFRPGGPLHKYKDGELLEKMIRHFERTEEYEKCAVLAISRKELLETIK